MRGPVLEPHLINVEQRSFASPETFRVPSSKERAAVRPGQQVKVGVEFAPVAVGDKHITGERFWVHVIAKSKRSFIGRVESDLIFTEQHGLRADDKIRFGGWNILVIGSDE